MATINYTACPACGSPSIHKKLGVMDHSVSGEIFQVYECSDCSLRFTQSAPTQDEIGRYYKSDAYISHTDSREGLINSIYHKVRNLTLVQKNKLIQKSTGVHSGKLLDIGAGTGAFASHMKKAGWEVTGLEPDAETRKRAFEINRLTLQPAENLFNLPSATFNAITLWHVLEHVHMLHEYLEQINRLLTDRGVAFIAVPNYTSSDAIYYGEFWAAYDVPRHLYHFSPASMKTLVAKHGLVVLAERPMWFDSFYVSMLSEKYKKGTAGNAGAFAQGLKSNLQASGNFERCSSVIYLIKKK